jgi:transcriptional regulator with XRE-family HTH domain
MVWYWWQDKEVSAVGIPAMARYQIKEVAASKGISLRRLANISRLNEARLRRLANNKLENVTVRTLEIIAGNLGVPFKDVFEPATLEEVPEIVYGDAVNIRSYDLHLDPEAC